MRTGLSYREALSIARSIGGMLAHESVPLACAHGRICADDFAAPFDLPGFANSAMDGYAIRGDDLHDDDTGASMRRFLLADRVFAGDTRRLTIAPGQAVAIMTGGMLPERADTVVIRENARVDGRHVWLPADARSGAHVRAADDDCAQGERILSRGDVLTAPRLSQLAAFGIERVDVVRRPRVAILVTGDELIPAGRPLVPGQRYDSNGPLLAALAAEAGADVVAREHCGDDPEALADALRRLTATSDMLLTSGGVSAGDADHLPTVIGRLGEIAFWKVRIKPGMPVLCARIGACSVFALPGNPVSAGVTFQVLACPSLAAIQGLPAPGGVEMRARLTVPWRKAHDRLEFLRVRLESNAHGERLATPFKRQGSGSLSILAQADALALLPEGPRDFEIGDVVEIYGFKALPADRTPTVHSCAQR